MMKADGLLAVLDRWGRATLPGAVLLFFVLLTLAPLRAP
jgi:rod shape-determining protein MreD